MSRKHAILGPSSASKWLTCTPSARLETQFPSTSGDAADEGTLAHSVGELIIAHRTKAITNKKFREQLAILETDKHYNKALYEYADGYAVYVLEQLAAARAISPDAQLFVEQSLDMGNFIPEGFGTGDAAVIAPGYLDVTDLKYGKGVSVSAENNPQLKIYALGWLAEYDYLYDIHTIRMTIYQPRMNNISTFEMRYADLMAWAELTLKPLAMLAFEGLGDFVAGKHCQFCRVKTTCRANAEAQMAIAQRDFAGITEDLPARLAPQLLSDEEIAKILEHVDRFKNWVKSVKEYALEQAKAGKKYPGYKLVSGKSSRVFTDKEAVQKILIKEGFDRTKMFKPQEMIGITEMEELTGKKLFDEKLAPFTVKKAGAPTLVDAADKRPEINDASADFADVTDELG